MEEIIKMIRGENEDRIQQCVPRIGERDLGVVKRKVFIGAFKHIQ